MLVRSCLTLFCHLIGLFYCVLLRCFGINIFHDYYTQLCLRMTVFNCNILLLCHFVFCSLYIVSLLNVSVEFNA
jgi:hypothetical protein